MILLNVSERSKLQLFLHWTNYPSEKASEHEYCFGNVPDELLKSLFSN